MNNRKKTLYTIALAVILTVALAGCMYSNQPTVPEATTQPTVLPNTTEMIQQASPGPQATNGVATGNQEVKERFDWRTRAAMVEARINLFSEIAESRVINYGTTALVGVKFTSQYQGELTQRIRDMIAGEVMAADDTIQVVAVTADPNDVRTIFDLSERLKTGIDEETLRDDIEKITRSATTLR